MDDEINIKSKPLRKNVTFSISANQHKFFKPVASYKYLADKEIGESSSIMDSETQHVDVIESSVSDIVSSDDETVFTLITKQLTNSVTSSNPASGDKFINPVESYKFLPDKEIGESLSTMVSEKLQVDDFDSPLSYSVSSDDEIESGRPVTSYKFLYISPAL